MVLLLYAAGEQNELAIEASEHLARSVLAAEADTVKNHARDYATWGEAVESLVLSFDESWADENIGTWANEGLGINATIVLDGRGQVTFGMIGGERLGPEIMDRVTSGLGELITMTRATPLDPLGVALSGYVLLDGGIAIAAAAPIVWTDGKPAQDDSGASAILVFVRSLDTEMLESIEQRYLLSGFHLAGAGDRPAGATVALVDLSGAVLGRLAWESDQPGFAMLRPLLVPGLVSVLVVALLFWFVVRRAQRTVRDLEVSHSTLQDLTVTLAAARDRAEQQARVESDLRDKAVAASRAKSEFLALVSHELRTPLNAILGFSETIATQVFGRSATERYRDYARDIHESGSHLLSIINDILDLSKIEAGRFDLHEEEVVLGDVLRRCAALLRERAEQSSLSLTCHDSSIRLRADTRALKQIVFNLLSNSIKFTGAGGRVELAAKVGADDLEIMVSDTGIGMTEDELSRARLPFGQAGSALTRSVGGTGLGLNVTEALIELHGGYLEIQTALGKGTIAIVHLPMERILASAPAVSQAGTLREA
ncbi:MAG: ATP-binding protein [Kiloniellaceae bacterium]